MIHIHVQMCLSMLLSVADAALENVLGLFNELAVQVNSVVGHAVGGVVLPEDEVACLLIVLVHLSRVPLTLIAQLFGLGAIAPLISLVRLHVTLRKTLFMIIETNHSHMERGDMSE